MTRIHAFAFTTPPLVTTAEIEHRIIQSSPDLKLTKGLIKDVSGIESRAYADDDTYNSTLAIKAAQETLKKANTTISDIDLLIFASAGQDLVEPATSHIISEALGGTCAVFDVKNACNSFLVAVEIADSFIKTKGYKKILITTGETPSKIIKWSLKDRQELKQFFPGFTFGDAGAAVMAEASDTPNIRAHKAWANSSYWSAGTLPGGGSRHPRGDEHSYFTGSAAKMKEAFVAFDTEAITSFLEVNETKASALDLIVTHQVSVPFVEAFFEKTKLPAEKMYQTVHKYGNIAAATIPASIYLAARDNRLKPGDTVLCVGLAGGISLQLMLFQYAG